MRLQLALNVRDLDRAVDYYSRLFDTPVHKRRPGYANFAIEDPPLKLVLFERPEADERLNHLGVELLEPGQIEAQIERIDAAGLASGVQRDTSCCHAVQDKVCSHDPQGLPWEWYVITDDRMEAAEPPPAPRPCC